MTRGQSTSLPICCCPRLHPDLEPAITRTPTPFTIRDYREQDAASWVRCRTLSFLGSSYYDDVHPDPTRFDGDAIRLVAVHPRPAGVTTPGPDEVIGLIDVELFDADGEAVERPETARTATIDSVAVHPDHLRRGVAGALLQTALARLQVGAPGVVSLDAWTREDEAATRWYLAHGFEDSSAYVHVHKGWQDQEPGWQSPEGQSAPVLAFAHGRLEDLEALRSRYARVYVCHQYLRRLG